MSVTTLTVPERQAKLEILATYDYDILDKTTVRELRILTEGVVINVTKFNKKADLVSHIMELTDKYREANRIALEVAALEVAKTKERNAELEAAKLSPATTKGYRIANNTETHSETLTDLLENLKKAASLATSEDMKDKAVDLAGTYFYNQALYFEPTTRKSNATDLYNALRKLATEYDVSGSKSSLDFQTVANAFERHLRSLMEKLNDGLRTKYKDEVSDRVNHLTPITCQPLIDHAIGILENPQDYRDVAVALIVLTGRRSAEVMATLKVLRPSSEPGKIWVSGLIKGKGDDEAKEKTLTTEHEIPALAPYDLIVAGMSYLEDSGRRIGSMFPNLRAVDMADEVNIKYAKTFKRQMSFWAAIAGITLTHRSPFTAKGLRALYAAVCLKRLRVVDPSLPEYLDECFYLARTMGHKANDLNTANSYKVWNIID